MDLTEWYKKHAMPRGVRKNSPVVHKKLNPETGEYEVVEREKSPTFKSKQDARVNELTTEPTRRLGKCGGITGVREHNQNNERLCRACLTYLDEHPEIDDAECGTVEGYDRHKHLGMKPCNSCISAKVKSQKESQ